MCDDIGNKATLQKANGLLTKYGPVLACVYLSHACVVVCLHVLSRVFTCRMLVLLPVYLCYGVCLPALSPYA